MKNVVRLHASSGTTGKPVVAGYTKGDIEVWSEAIARIVTAGGIDENDVVQISFGYGLFTGGFGLHYGIEKVGATIVPMSSGNTQETVDAYAGFWNNCACCNTIVCNVSV